MNLDELAGRVPERAVKTAVVDMTDHWGDGAEIMFSEPSTATWFGVRADALEVRKRRPAWPDELAQLIALLAMCHEAPAPGRMTPGEFYVHLAANDASAFAAVVERFNAAFPHLRDLQAAGAEAKNG